MTLSQMQYFLALSKTKSYTKAAQICYTSQPNLSRQIAAMERELGFQLVIRDKQHVELTASGEEMSECFRKMLGLYQDTRDSILDNTFSIPFKLGSMNGFYQIADSVRELYKSGKYPNMKIQNAGENQFKAGEMDICFVLNENVKSPCFLNVFRKKPLLLIPKQRLSENTVLTQEKLEEIGITLPNEGYDANAGVLMRCGYKGKLRCFEYFTFDYDSYLMDLRLSGSAGYLVNDIGPRYTEDYIICEFPESLQGVYAPVGIMWNPEKDMVCRRCAEDLKRLINEKIIEGDD